MINFRNITKINNNQRIAFITIFPPLFLNKFPITKWKSKNQNSITETAFFFKELVFIKLAQRYHESLNNLTPADVYLGKYREILSRREKIKIQTIIARRKKYYEEKLNLEASFKV